MLRSVVVLLFVCGTVARISAQDPAAHNHAEMSPASTWTWTADANAFFGYNYQLRRLVDYSEWESQNWAMLGADRKSGSGQLSFTGMFSLEPFTMRAQGSPQLFQTGESYQSIPLVNFQHPHDLIMGLGATYRHTRPRVTYTLGADLVGSPTLGPTPFMHRESGRNNPQVPVTHHYFDATHISMGVVRGGVTFGSLTLEASTFRGAGPDEDRLNIERPYLDSWAVRGQWRRGPWHVQVSGGHLRQPEWFEPFDATLLTASIAFNGHVRDRPLSAMLAWGETRQFNGFNGIVDGYLLEWNLGATDVSSQYARLEVASKELFGLGPHEKEFAHRHWFSLITALTLGYIRDLPFDTGGRFGVGADITLYRMPADIDSYFGASRSFHVFVRWRPAVSLPHVH